MIAGEYYSIGKAIALTGSSLSGKNRARRYVLPHRPSGAAEQKTDTFIL
jgi:hypothetical protein